VLTPEDLEVKGWCCVCRARYESSVAEAHLITDFRMDLGELCPACLERGDEHIERVIQKRAELLRMKADAYERAASEYVEDCPSIEEYRTLERAIGRPRYGSLEEADEAYGVDYKETQVSLTSRSPRPRRGPGFACHHPH
jgi:hypothetical protein